MLPSVPFFWRGRGHLAAWSVGLVAVVAVAAVPALVAQQDAASLQGKTDPDADFSDELPRIAANSPQQSHKLLHPLPGFQIELAASEPQVVDPIACSFDERGRLYVICMRDYSEQEHDQLGEVRLLEDADNDGVYERSTIFAEKLSWPTAIICYDGGVFVGAPPHIYYLKDTDGDGRADQQDIVFTGFGRSNVQGLLNSFRWGLDNRIHGATSSSGATVTRPGVDEPPVVLKGRDFAFNPRTLKLEPTSGGAQHGLDFDAWGRKFVCSNSSHLEMVFFEDRYLMRNPAVAAPSPRRLIAIDGGQAEVFRRSPIEPWRIVRTRLRVAGTVRGVVEGGGRAAGYFTGATGVTIYRGDAWPEAYRGQAFIGDVGSNIVHRKQLVTDGVGFQGVRVDEGREFLASEEIWFRPVQFAHAPDGTLYVLDMYREVIEHPHSIPPMIKQHLDLTSGRDRGRIWRIAPTQFERRPNPRLDEASTDKLVQLLSHPNAWHRETAARLLYQRQPQEAIPELRRLASQGEQPLGRMHALYVLVGLDALDAPTVAAALGDPHPRIREHAVRLAEPLLAGNEALAEQLLAMTGDDDARVRYQLAFSLGELPSSPRRQAALVELARKDSGDSWLRLAIYSSLAEGAGEVFLNLAGNADYAATSPGRTFLGELARQIGTQGRQADIAAVLKAIDGLPDSRRPLAGLWVQQLAQGMKKSGSALRTQLSAVTDDAGSLLDGLLVSARNVAGHERAALADRLAAIETLGLSDLATERQLLTSLLDNRQPQQVQSAALRTLSRFTTPEVGAVVLTHWQGYSPTVRSQATEVLFARPDRIQSLLDAIESGQARPQDLEPARIQFLRQHKQAEIRTRAEKLLAEVQLARRQDVVDAYQSALAMQGDARRGKAVFTKTCAACHRLEGQGHEIGPNLAAMRNRGPEAILLNVLDPNREVNPQYLNYVAITTDGRSITGMVAAETATSVTLRRAENQSDTILRNEIDTMQSSGLSIMPEGMEKDISPQAMADLIAYLLSVK